MNDVINVENFFKSHQVYLSRIWLESCITWCKEENLPSNYTLKDLQLKVFDQWLLLDLRDVEIPCLPPNILSKDKYVLQDNYTLQLMQVVDISKPKYWQLQRIRNGIPKNLEQEFESSKRVLQLTLTDGVQEVEATEYKPIKCLNLNLSPGIKIRLMGPIQVRRGRLMLEEKNVKVIGGEVDTLLVTNAAENILAKHLNQPLNSNPEIIQESILTANKDMFDETGTSVSSFNSNVQNNLRSNVTNFTKNVNLIQNNHIHNQNSERNSTSNNVNWNKFPTIDDFEDNFNVDQEIDMLMEVERDFEQNKISTKNKTPDMFDDIDIDFESIDIPNAGPSSSKKNLKPNPTISNILNMKNDSTDLSKESLKQNSSNKILCSPTPVTWSIQKLVKTMPNITNGKFKIKAKFKKIVEKMTVTDNSFHLVVEVEDSTGEISLKLHCSVVTELIGHSVEDFMQLREQWLKGSAEAKTMVLEALERLKNHLQILENVLEILVSAGETYPVLLKIL